MRIPRPRLNLIEMAMVAALVGVMAYTAGRFRAETRLRPFLSLGIAELQPLVEKYGPAHNSRYGEEWIIRDFFGDERDGVFLDVGANHFQRDSNTYYLETALGWSGIAIEPQTKFARDYASNRPKTTFIPLFVSDHSNGEAMLYVPKDDLLASADKEFAKSEGGGDVEPVRANTTTLDDVLERHGATRIDFVSIDVELHEPQALKGFTIERFKPRLVCIEGHPEVRQQILDYFATHGYVLVGKYIRADSENLWFMPISLPNPSRSVPR